MTDETPVLTFKEDLDYWGMPDHLMESCCGEKLSSRLGVMDEEMEAEASKLILDDVEDFGVGRWARHQKYLWDLIEKPDTSPAAKWMSYIRLESDQTRRCCQQPSPA